MAALSSAAACSVPPRARMRCRARMRHRRCMHALRKLAEKSPDRLGAVDVAILRPEQACCDLREAGIRRKSGHAMAATVDAIEYDVVAFGTARGDPCDRGLVCGRLVGQIGHVG